MNDAKRFTSYYILPSSGEYINILSMKNQIHYPDRESSVAIFLYARYTCLTFQKFDAKNALRMNRQNYMDI